jgi:peptidoglycan/LPS O-acetylase OafA/YrhL
LTNSVAISKVDTLTGLRAYAALWVLMFHISADAFYQNLPLGVLKPLFLKGYLGVDIFFMLSGFVISYVYQKKLIALFNQKVLGFGSESFWSGSWLFWKNRFTRIFFVHWGMLFIYLILVLCRPPIHHPEDFSGLSFVWNLLNVHAWGITPDLTWNKPSWSVSAEWFVYLLFPLVFSQLGRLKGQWPNILVIGAMVAFFAIYAASTGCESLLAFPLDKALIRIVVEFTIGCCLYNLYRQQAGQHWPWAVVVVGVVAFLVAGFYTGLSDFMGLPLLALGLYGLVFLQGRLARVLTHPVVIYLGEISYSLYMTHGLVLLGFPFVIRLLLGPQPLSAAQSIICFITMTFVALAVASLSFYSLEKPFRRRVVRP